jgi:hypothetical protein
MERDPLTCSLVAVNEMNYLRMISPHRGEDGCKTEHAVFTCEQSDPVTMLKQLKNATIQVMA